MWWSEFLFAAIVDYASASWQVLLRRLARLLVHPLKVYYTTGARGSHRSMCVTCQSHSIIYNQVMTATKPAIMAEASHSSPMKKQTNPTNKRFPPFFCGCCAHRMTYYSANE